MNKNYKRTSRHLSPVVRQKISNALRGRTKTEAEREAISNGLKNYWGNPANFNDPEVPDDGGGV